MLALALSAIRSLVWWTVLAGAGILLLAALALTRSGRSRTSLAMGFKALRTGLSEPIVAALAIAAAIGLSYSIVLGVLTPPNDWDAMSYHLARAALWIQQDAVAYVDNSPYAPINAYPPNAEIGALFTLILAHSDRYVGLVQYSAMIATATATFGIARRIGIELTAALFGALAFLTLPVVVLQSWTALNDLVVASFLITAVYFLLRHDETRACPGRALAGTCNGNEVHRLRRPAARPAGRPSGTAAIPLAQGRACFRCGVCRRRLLADRQPRKHGKHRRRSSGCPRAVTRPFARRRTRTNDTTSRPLRGQPGSRTRRRPIRDRRSLRDCRSSHCRQPAHPESAIRGARNRPHCVGAGRDADAGGPAPQSPREGLVDGRIARPCVPRRQPRSTLAQHGLLVLRIPRVRAHGRSSRARGHRRATTCLSSP